MRGSCAGKFDSRYGVFIFPVVKVKTHKIGKMVPLFLRFLCFYMFIMNSTNEMCDNTHDVFCMFMRGASAVRARFMRGE